MHISPTQHDALREVMNIAIGRAARLLGELVGKLIHLDVPNIHIVSPVEINKLLKSFGDTKNAVTISQEFAGSIAGRVGLSFSQQSAATLLTILEERPSGDLKRFSVAELSALEEVANILLNGAISAIADLLDEMIQLSLPMVRTGDSDSGYSQWLADGLEPLESAFIVVAANMRVEDQSLQGMIVLSMAVVQIEEMIKKLD